METLPGNGVHIEAPYMDIISSLRLSFVAWYQRGKNEAGVKSPNVDEAEAKSNVASTNELGIENIGA